MRTTRAVDGALAAAVLLVGLVGTVGADGLQDPPRGLDPGAFALVVVAAVALVARRARPVPVLAVVAAATTAYVALGYAFGPILVALGVALATAVALAAPVRAPALAVGAVAVAAVVRIAANPGADRPESLGPLASWLLVPWLLGAVLRLRREAAVRSRREIAAGAATDERLRVAREVHDVAGHGFAVIAMQAGVALHVLERRPEQARVALEEIRAASRGALAELRDTLDVVAGDTDPARRVAGAGLAELDGLLARMRGAGLAVSLDVTGTPRGLPADADLAAYRILQESLTNVLRHAGAGAARVRLAYGEADLAVCVEDDGPGGPGGGGAVSGRGLAGMRERAVGVGGSFEAGPRPEGGFRVTATIPAATP